MGLHDYDLLSSDWILPVRWNTSAVLVPWDSVVLATGAVLANDHPRTRGCVFQG